jgi:hypothetical protein
VRPFWLYDAFVRVHSHAFSSFVHHVFSPVDSHLLRISQEARMQPMTHQVIQFRHRCQIYELRGRTRVGGEREGKSSCLCLEIDAQLAALALN